MEQSHKSSKKKIKKHVIQKVVSRESELVTRVNIDSRHRNVESKNIINGSINYLEPNPLTVLVGDTETEVIVSQSGHKFQVNDNLVLQGVGATSIILNDAITFIGNSSYAKINHKNHGLDFSAVNNMYIFISGFKGNLNGDTTFNNIPINEINTIHKVYPIKDSKETYNGDYYYILMHGVISNFSSTYKESSIKIAFNDINGINLNLFNANYPIDVSQKQGYHTVVDTTEDTYTIVLPIGNNVPMANKGGTNIWTAKVDEFIQGYSKNNHYKIPLRRTFQNVSEIILKSTEIPNTEKVVKSSGNKKNNAFYWKIENDGDAEYVVELDSGNYSIELLKTTLESKINNVLRDTVRIVNLNTTGYEYHTYNQCSVTIEPRTNLFSIRFYSTIFYPNALSYRPGSNFEDGYSRLIITHPDHGLIVGSGIQVINAIATDGVPQNVLNNIFSVEKVISDNAYQVKLPRYNISSVDRDVTNGGNSMGIKFHVKSQLLMSKSDSIGSLLGFRNIGKVLSITPFDFVNNNHTEYLIDHVNEDQPINNSIKLTGDNYILMTSPIINSSLNSGPTDHVFAKLLLTDEPGTVIYDKFVQLGQHFNPPLPELSEWEVSFYDASGELFDFGDIEHSYTLEIHEKIINISEKA